MNKLANYSYRDIKCIIVVVHVFFFCVFENFSPMVLLHVKSIADTGSAPNSAQSMQVKFKSRQAVYEARGYQNVNFSETDTLTNCMEINQASFSFARSLTDVNTLNRFDSLGEPVIFGEDIDTPNNIFPLWTLDPLRYETVYLNDDPSQPQLQIRSCPFLKTLFVHPDRGSFSPLPPRTENFFPFFCSLSFSFFSSVSIFSMSSCSVLSPSLLSRSMF